MSKFFISGWANPLILRLIFKHNFHIFEQHSTFLDSRICSLYSSHHIYWTPPGLELRVRTAWLMVEYHQKHQKPPVLTGMMEEFRGRLSWEEEWLTDGEEDGKEEMWAAHPSLQHASTIITVFSPLFVFPLFSFFSLFFFLEARGMLHIRSVVEDCVCVCVCVCVCEPQFVSFVCVCSVEGRGGGGLWSLC